MGLAHDHWLDPWQERNMSSVLSLSMNFSYNVIWRGPQYLNARQDRLVTVTSSYPISVSLVFPLH